MKTHGDRSMDMVTSTETTVMEVGLETPESTPIARKTRSHDGVKPCLQRVDTPNPKQILDNLKKHINSEIQVAKEKNAEKKDTTLDQPAYIKRLIDTQHSFSVHSRKILGTPVHKGKGPDHTWTRGWTVG